MTLSLSILTVYAKSVEPISDCTIEYVLSEKLNSAFRFLWKCFTNNVDECKYQNQDKKNPFHSKNTHDHIHSSSYRNISLCQAVREEVSKHKITSETLS